jgi:hypothetical protein
MAVNIGSNNDRPKLVGRVVVLAEAVWCGNASAERWAVMGFQAHLITKRATVEIDIRTLNFDVETLPRAFLR